MNLHSSRPSPSTHGFTLIELLTVIAIIGILAAIIIPTVGKVRQTANMSRDASNLRQIGMAALSYAGENKDTLPPGGAYIDGREASWDMLLSPWLNTAVVNTSQKRPSVIMSPLDPNVERTGRSYSFNRCRINGNVLGAAGLAFGDPLTTPNIAFRLAQFPEPSRTILATARPDANQIAANFAFAGIDAPQQQIDSDVVNGSRFNGTFNYVMVDGSVRRMRALDSVGTGGTLASPQGYWTRAAGD